MARTPGGHLALRFKLVYHCAYTDSHKEYPKSVFLHAKRRPKQVSWGRFYTQNIKKVFSHEGFDTLMYFFDTLIT